MTAEHVCCWHQVYTSRSENAVERWTQTTERCCYGGETRVRDERSTLQPDTAHGPHAPKVWVRQEYTP